MIKFANNKTTRIIAICASYGLVLILLYIFAGRGISRYSNSLSKQLGAQTNKIKQYEELIRSYPNPDKEIEAIETKIDELKGKAASREQIPRIIQQLARKTNELNINTLSIKPRDDISNSDEKLIQGVGKVYIEIVMLTPYQVVGDYLKSLIELPVILTVENISIDKKQKTYIAPGSANKDDELRVTLLLSAYMVLEI
ncbi:type 4a pilus biogenesis protein PilO [Candidatus Omnitrophota bacterium]